MHDAMPQELAGTGVFTNRCGAGRLLPAESLPFGSCARLDYVLIPQDSVVTQWHMPSDLNHCSDTHSPVLATIQYSHPKGSGARRCAARDSAARDPVGGLGVLRAASALILAVIISSPFRVPRDDESIVLSRTP